MKIRVYKDTILIIMMIMFFFLFSFFSDVKESPVSSSTTELAEKLKANELIEYLVIGDSIGRGSGADRSRDTWFAQMEQSMLADSGIKMNGQLIVQSGATAFEGLYKLQHTQLNKEIDLIFIFFGENDRKYMGHKDFSQFYEALVRTAKHHHKGAEIITVIESSLTREEFAKEIRMISEYYGAIPLDMRPIFLESGKPIRELTRDNIHPNKEGYSLYASNIVEILQSFPKRPTPMMPERPYVLKEDIELKKSHAFHKHKGFYFNRGTLTSDMAGSTVCYYFNGSTIGAVLDRAPDGGYVDVYIDNKYYTTLNTWWPFPRERYQFISNGLTDGKHHIVFKTTGKKSEANISNHSYIRLSGIITGHTVTK